MYCLSMLIGAAIKVAKIATKETTESPATDAQAVKCGKAGGAKGGPARPLKLSPQQREEIARVAASARWKKSD